ncbi:hypothetical protein HIM_02782 [Hirsutella minnesotensis 3608]|nr:hypothetical protein HIM_02782 [Hirsutella minnesotensis 3608]
MAPSTEELEAALIDASCQVYKDDPDAISVNKVRQHAENKLDLEDGFFSEGDWKHKSKALIKEYVDKLLDGWTPDAAKEQKKPKNGTKRPSPEAKSPEPKRRKRPPQPPKLAKKQVDDDSSELSELGESPEPKGPAGRPKSKQAESDDGSLSSSPAPKRKRKSESKSKPRGGSKSTTKRQDPADSDENHESNNPLSHSKDEQKQSDLNADEETAKPIPNSPAVDEEEEYSDVIDEQPPAKRKKKERKESTSKQSKSTAKKAPTASNDDPDQAEIKKLQSHLVKCGIRKLWHNELKKYGDDARAKIRHLKKMLADVGMDGRFSEAKAREIKESRELMAEMEAAQEMNRLWGKSSGGRASRTKSKSTKLEESEGSDANEKDDVKGDDEDDEEESNTFAARRRRAQADLAFLGDDSDSD